MKNGQIPAAKLVSIGGGTLPAKAARSWLAMAAHAARDGIDLRCIGGYRTDSAQEVLFRDRYRAQATGVGPYGDVRYWRGVRYVRVRGAAAAVPGTSNHGLGRAVDIAGTSVPYGAAPTQVTLWLRAHAADYGWALPAWALTRALWEPWHYEYDKKRDRHVEVVSRRKVRTWQKHLGTTADGIISVPSGMVRAVQARLGITQTGILDGPTNRALKKQLNRWREQRRYRGKKAKIGPGWGKRARVLLRRSINKKLWKD